jgi:uncharacterized protein
MSAPYRLSITKHISDVPRADWNAIANPPSRAYHPFMDWDFLEALERSGCATPKTGWAPHHLLLHDASGKLVGAAPLYLKSHSQGEYVFDHSWADAFNRAGGSYYPKLLCAAPFTPAMGPRLLAGDENREAIEAALLQGAIDIARDNNISVAQFNFLTDAQAELCREAGMLIRHDQQFHFINDHYADFDAFLAKLASDKRKNLRKERRKAQDGLEILHLTGDALTKEHWDFFFKCYMDTGSRKWGQPYLNRAFFRLIHERMADKVLLLAARDLEGNWVASALNFIGGDTLYGRYWGRLEDRPFLHFELCYYQAIDAALARGLKRVEAGAQGEHKLARGYAPVLTTSAHFVTDPGFRSALESYLTRERKAVAQHAELLGEYTPFRKEN